MICLNCGRKLKSAASRAARYGPVCYKKMFGINLRSDRKDSILETTDIPCYDMPGQITLEEYFQTILK